MLKLWIKLLKRGINACMYSCCYGKYINVVVNKLVTRGILNVYEWNVSINIVPKVGNLINMLNYDIEGLYPTC